MSLRLSLLSLLPLLMEANADISMLWERLDNTTKALNETHRELSQAINGLPALTWERACPENYGFGSYSYSLGTHPLYGNLSVNTDIVMFKQIDNGAPLRIINGVQSLLSTFQNNLAQINRSTLMYVGGHDMFGIFPAFNFTTCNVPISQQYCPTCRPWWTSSTIGKGNYILFLDITQGHNVSQFEYLRALVVDFVKSLSFYDYFTVITYDVLSYEFSEHLVQATDDNKNRAIDWVNQITNDGLYSTSIGGVLQEGLVILNQSIMGGSSANCHNYLIFFSSGDATINDPHAYDVLSSDLAQTNSTLTISVYLAEEGRNADVFTGITCRTGGFVSIINTSLLLQDHMFIFNTWYSKYINIRKIRYSAVYLDAFGLGHMTTGGKPVYNGSGHVLVVNAMDVTIDGLNLTINEINNALQSRQECEALQLPFIETSSCPQKNPAEAESKPALVEYKDLIFGFCVTVTVLWTFFMIYRYGNKAQNEDDGADLIVLLWIGACVAWIIFWTCYLPYLYPDQIVYTHYKETKEYTTAVTVRPYECTETRDCQCSNYFGRTCDHASEQLLATGSLNWSLSCQTGYHCCEWITYCGHWTERCRTSCSGSGRSRTCSTHCYPYCSFWIDECVQDVSARACTEVRGICNRVYVDTEYITDTGTVNAVRSTNCRLNNTGCVDEFIGKFAEVGYYIEGWYNPWNPTEVVYERKWNIAAWVFLAIACTYLAVTIVFTLLFECRNVSCPTCPTCPSGSPSPSGSSSPSITETEAEISASESRIQMPSLYPPQPPRYEESVPYGDIYPPPRNEYRYGPYRDIPMRKWGQTVI